MDYIKLNLRKFKKMLHLILQFMHSLYFFISMTGVIKKFLFYNIIKYKTY